MYRQILVTEPQRRLQLILWRENPASSIEVFELNTVTYDTASAPFLATRALYQLANDEQVKYPKAAHVTKRDFYVDDILSGADTVEEALIIQRQLLGLLKSGGFVLHKWCSNDSTLLFDATNSQQGHQVDILTLNQLKLWAYAGILTKTRW
jgi:hypothetical protein